MNIILITGSELRHEFFRKAISLDDSINVVQSYCEGSEKALHTRINLNDTDSDIQLLHAKKRKQSEEDFFLPFVALTKDVSNPIFIKKGDINNQEIIERIIKLDVDLIVAYGCSIIKEPILDYYKNKILNLHLGLSPYYRGSGTNFWPLVNNEPQYVGATFMFMDEGIDTGSIIHQIRARIFKEDSPHQIGNRLISDAISDYIKIIKKFKYIESGNFKFPKINSKFYKIKDFTPRSVKDLYENFSKGMIENYLSQENKYNLSSPILINKII